MCGVIGVLHGDSSSTSAAVDIHDSLFLLQHRGQDACGIATCASQGRIYQCKGSGLALKVFQDGNRVSDLPGYMGVGHLRYPTAGTRANSEAQPFYVNSPYGIVFAHNGNLINAPNLKHFLDQEAHRHINTDSDSELMLNAFANELNETGKARVNADDCLAGLARTYARCEGAWACTAMIAGLGLMGFRDAWGIRPLIMGSRTVDGITDYMIASESVALQYFGCHDKDMVDIKPGEAVILEKGQKPRFHQVEEPKGYCPDMFEYVYFARPDSVIDGISVYLSRRNMGERLAKKIERQLGPEIIDEIDAVIPIPETAITSAEVVAKHLKKDFVMGFVKNRYIFRTFIMPNQRVRRTGVRRKLNAMRSQFEGKNVLLVDDSIVRGTTSKEIVQMAKEAGAKQVYLASCAPAIKSQHIYGIDLASTSELIAFSRTGLQISQEIGADGVVYQDLADLEAACAQESPRGVAAQKFEVGVFSGQYITPVSEGYLRHLEALQGEQKKRKQQEKAINAIVNGVANQDDLRLVEGTVNGAGAAKYGGSPVLEPEDRQDVALHNFHDYREG